ncbi:MAG: TetR family transcriptional regulator [Propionibacteriaceae bacterium]
MLAAARAQFAAVGYAGATVRAIASSAGVDPAMINHHFGGKHQLFLATLDLGDIDPAAHLAAVTADGLDGLGERLLRRLLAVWDSPVGAAGVAMLRTAMQDEQASVLVREFVVNEAVGPLSRAISADRRVVDATARRQATLVASQVLGVVMLRYVLAVDPLASASPDDVVGAVAPTLQCYLDGGPLGGGPLGGGAPPTSSLTP